VVLPADSDFLRRVPGEVNTWLWTLGRLKPGVTLAQAEASLEAVSVRLEEEYGEWNEGQGVALSPYRFHPSAERALVPLLRLLAWAVGIVLALATANLAILLLARGAARRRELAVRSALGAGRGRVARELLVESLLLALAGGGLGLLLARWASGAGRPCCRWGWRRTSGPISACSASR